ncbi:hypothetical protein KGF54_004748 [Candida jiufengensis]|uniref:uncharacterized protein n=1 Tax=Candida jiufengensis TaxID=497108 RepID=UPI002223FFD1|nr:uncharacterized protein KGF54_004748 [Candida jiufengensis]KAI5951673.1 hypothetical protein KGF54_004748 [Candida jiufengensis]
MSTKGPSIAPRHSSTQSPIAIAGSPPSCSSTGSTPRSIASPNNPQSPLNNSAMSPSNTNDTTQITTSTTSTIRLGVSSIMTSKEWVLPPRPKPGRKPSIDTPASKRKAQNRAAQRAFRERRATRVQELEQKLMEVEKEKDIKEMALVNTINKLKAENNYLNKNMEQLRQEMNQFKNSQDQMRIQMQQQQQQSQPNQNRNKQPSKIQNNTSQLHQNQQTQTFRNTNNNQPSPMNTSLSPTGSSYSLQQISPAPSADSPMNTNISSSQNYPNSSNSALTPISNNTTPDKLISTTNSNDSVIDSSNFDCGICIKDECLCESVGLKDPKPTKTNDVEKQLQQQLNSFKPEAPVQLNRKRKAIINSDIELKEIDFTKKFATKAKPMPDLNKLKKMSTKTSSPIKSKPSSTDNILNSEFNENSPMENCGFCSDDTPCVCREAAKEAARLNASLNEQERNIILEEDENDHGLGDYQNDEDNKTSLPPLQYNLSSNNIMKSSLPVMHPGPSVEISTITNLTPGAIPTVIPRRNNEEQQQSETIIEESVQNEEKDGCTGNPGTCKQCQMDPMSTLFCTTVASKSNEYSNIRPNLSRKNSKSSLTLNFGGPSTPTNNNNAPSPIPPPLIASSNNNAPSPGPLTPGSTNNNGGIFIPCADAYKTLSRHKKFNSVDFSTLVGKLTTRGMQVEVQSVANVLRELDRRVYN